MICYKLTLNKYIPPDHANFNFYLVDFPLNILVPEGKNIVRLGLELELLPGENQTPSRPLVMYDLFPPDQWQLKETNLGEAEIDISKALTFIPTAGKALGDCLGLKLKLPIKWMTETVQVRTTDRMSNPVCWLVTDKSIQHGFTAYTIIRSPKGINVNLNAVLTCDLRSSGILGKKTHGKTPRKTYHIS